MINVAFCLAATQRASFLHEKLSNKNPAIGNSFKSGVSIPGGITIESESLKSQHQRFSEAVKICLLKSTPLPSVFSELIFSYLTFIGTQAQEVISSQGIILSLTSLGEGIIYVHDISNSGRILNYLSNESTIYTLPRQIPERSYELDEGADSMIDFAQSPKWVASADEQGAVWLWPKSMRFTQAKAQGVMTCVSSKDDFFLTARFSPCGLYLLIGSYLGAACIFDLQAKELLLRFSHSGPVTEITSTPDGDTLLVGTKGGGVYAWHSLLLSQLRATKEKSQQEARNSILSPLRVLKNSLNFMSCGLF